MNQGKRYILYTVFAMCGVTVAVAAATRLYATAVDENTPHWKRNVMSLGLAVAVKSEPVPGSSVPSVLEGGDRIVDLDQFRDLEGLAIEGDVTVQIGRASRYRMIITPGTDVTFRMATDKKEGGQLRIRAGGTGDIALRIEAPALSSIEAQSLRQLTIRGWQAPALTLRMSNVDDVHLEESIVWRWILHAETPAAVTVDKATAAAGLNIQHRGQIRVTGPAGQKINLRGTRGNVSVRFN